MKLTLEKTKAFWIYIVGGALAMILGGMLMPVWKAFENELFFRSWGEFSVYIMECDLFILDLYGNSAVGNILVLKQYFKIASVGEKLRLCVVNFNTPAAKQIIFARIKQLYIFSVFEKQASLLLSNNDFLHNM